MSDKLKYPAIAAMRVADQLIAELAPVCERIVVAGSLRRKKTSVSDAELLYIPKYEMRRDPEDLLGQYKMTNVADLVITQLEKTAILARRISMKGAETFGEKNKLMVHCQSGIPVDMFATTFPNWWVSLVVRTGSLETNLRLTNGAIARGGSLQAYGSGVKFAGRVSECYSEEDVFGLCGVPFIPPEKR